MKRKDFYIAELIFNLNRFVEDSIISHPTVIVSEFPEDCYIAQKIVGDYTAISAIYADEETLTKFAAAYSKIDMDHYDGLVNELTADFLNLHNGLFLVNLSESENVESTLDPPNLQRESFDASPLGPVYVMPVEFKFGTVNFVLSE